jgi:hypothetical protein
MLTLSTKVQKFAIDKVDYTVEHDREEWCKRLHYTSLNYGSFFVHQEVEFGRKLVSEWLGP